MSPIDSLLSVAFGLVVGVALSRHPRPLSELKRQQEQQIQLVASLSTDQKSLQRLLELEQERLDRLECQSTEVQERTTALVADTLSLGSTANSRLDQLELQIQQLNVSSDRVREVMEARLQEMQGFIVSAAEEAQRRRQALEQPAAVPAPMVKGNTALAPAEELATLLRQQRQLQEAFELRRQGEQAFRQPTNGAGL